VKTIFENDWNDSIQFAFEKDLIRVRETLCADLQPWIKHFTSICENHNAFELAGTDTKFFDISEF